MLFPAQVGKKKSNKEIQTVFLQRPHSSGFQYGEDYLRMFNDESLKNTFQKRQKTFKFWDTRPVSIHTCCTVSTQTCTTGVFIMWSEGYTQYPSVTAILYIVIIACVQLKGPSKDHQWVMNTGTCTVPRQSLTKSHIKISNCILCLL